MRRFLSIVLIVMILTSQGLCVVHAHVGMASSHSDRIPGAHTFMCTARILMDPMQILQITIMMMYRCCLQ
jgi:hypothetical protein